MGVPRLARRLWRSLWNRHSVGRIVIKFYPRGGEASITVSPALAAVPRRYWHWLYLQHLAESLAAIGEAHERLRLLVAARAMAEDFVSRSCWPRLIGESIAAGDAGAGAAVIVPERDGGVALETRVVQRGDGMPAMRLTWSPPEARDRIASSSLVLLVHVMRGAAHPLEHYEVFKKIALFVEYCERAGCPRDRATLKAGALHAVVHADLTEMASPGGFARQKVAAPAAVGKDAPPRRDLSAGAVPPPSLPTSQPRQDRRARAYPFWKRSEAAIGGAVVLWAGLALGAFFLPPGVHPVPAPRPVASVPSMVRQQDTLPSPRHAERPSQPQIALTPPPVSRRSAPAVMGRPGGASAAQPRRPSPESEGSDVPKFRVVSSTLSLDVAEHRLRVLAEQGIDSFVQEKAGRLGRLQYGAYHFRETAEEDARHFRAQGYTAVVIPY